MTPNNTLPSDSPSGPSATPDTTLGPHATNPTGTATANSPRDTNPTSESGRLPELVHTAMRAYPVVEALSQYSHRNDIHSLAHVSTALRMSISASGVLGHKRHWPSCPGDIFCYGCDTPLCIECSQWKTIYSQRQPVPILQGCCMHHPIMILHKSEGTVTRQHVCRICVEKTEEVLMGACLRIALKKVASASTSQLACQRCAS